MKRFLLSALSAVVVAAMIGLTGCDSGGGIEPGVPQGAGQQTGGKLPIDADVSKGPKEGAKPKPDAAAPAPEKDKDAPKG
jgi:hypothetical protein